VGSASSKQAEIEAARAAVEEGWAQQKPFDASFGHEHWVKWATVMEAMRVFPVHPGQAVLDVGCGAGWTSAFLAEAGYRVTGIDIAPAYVDAARRRAERWGLDAEFAAADMEDFSLGRSFRAALVFDALHHVDRPERSVASVAAHLEPGGWVLFGEPSWLHAISPRARRVHRELGVNEHAIRVSRLRRWCADAGLGNFTRFFEGTRPYRGRAGGFGWQLARLVAANVWVAPHASVWLAAQRPEATGPR
jgi:2-polyprenyl-3-methyl-5-hydroxy-6-metoxy-1,4-benzoquinol methylase